jgi:rRNA-processing protein FCF1
VIKERNLFEFEKLIEKDYKIFVDTSSLMQKNSDVIFFKYIAPLMHKYQRKLIIPKSVFNEISKHNYNHHPNIHRANHILNELSKFELYGQTSTFDEKFADNALLSQFTALRLKYNLCLITSDYSYNKDGNLSQDILDLKRSRSTDNINDIRVFNILSTSGEFKEFRNVKNFKDKNKKKTPINTNNDKVKKDKNFKFSLPSTPKKNDKVLSPKLIPEVGQYVFDNNGTNHKLKKQIGRTGGEGSVYLTDTGYICKIYKKERVTSFREAKINLLIKHHIKVDNVCLPEYIAYNNHEEFVGYLMKQASGKEMKSSIFIRPLFDEKFPHWNRSHLAKVALNIIKMVQGLHNHNIILGDINPNNFLIKDENTVFIIDTDSFQIEEYPCPVGMLLYTKKENHGKRYENYLRTKEDDIFALSTLVFQLMLPGKAPYSFSGGGTEKENMKPENFPYKCDKSGYNNAPDGQWVYIWSHLPYKLKQLFCRVFRKSEKIDLNELVQQMESYIYQLDQGHQTKEIFPKTFKQVNEDGNVVHDDYSTFYCSSCGREFAIPNSKIKSFKSKGWKIPTQCELCRDNKKNNIQICTKCGNKVFEPGYTECKSCRGMLLTCNSCYSSFLFSDGEKDFFNKKGLAYPKKCKSCR